MEKLLIIHTRYIERGGEDIAVDNEVNFLKNFYNVEYGQMLENLKKIKL